MKQQSRRLPEGAGAAVFPGEIAGASLKPDRSLRRVFARPVVFPGEIAGASLKRLVGRRDRAVEDGFSPAKSPGPH